VVRQVKGELFDSAIIDPQVDFTRLDSVFVIRKSEAGAETGDEGLEGEGKPALLEDATGEGAVAEEAESASGETGEFSPAPSNGGGNAVDTAPSPED
jgi:hypothetical protein